MSLCVTTFYWLRHSIVCVYVLSFIDIKVLLRVRTSTKYCLFLFSICQSDSGKKVGPFYKDQICFWFVRLSKAEN